MTQKTINCAECGVEFTFEENPKYPRKYCLNCSAQKKASYQNSSFKHASESRPTHTPEGEPLVVHEKPGAVPVQQKGTAKDKGFEAHLSIETVRSNALASAIDYWARIQGISTDRMEIVKITKEFEQYILTGE